MGLVSNLVAGVSRQGVQAQGKVWVREIEHIALRVVSLGFSLGSAHAIRWFFSPLDGADVLQPIITWVIAGGFGVLGYFLSRGLAHRLMNKESFWSYLPICIVVEFVEIFCNFALAASVISQATWLERVPAGMQDVLSISTYVVLSAIPLVSIFLAVVDVDLARGKHNGGTVGGRAPVPVQRAKGAQAQGPQPKAAPQWGQPAQGQPAYGAGYGGTSQGGTNGATPLQGVRQGP